MHSLKYQFRRLCLFHKDALRLLPTTPLLGIYCYHLYIPALLSHSACFLDITTMDAPPVYLKTSDVVPKVLLPLTKCSPEKILNMTWGVQEDFWSGEGNQKERGEFLQSSFDDRDCTNMRPERHGLFGTVLLAFREHNHLVLRQVLFQWRRIWRLRGRE